MTKRWDLDGQRFGRLVVLHRVKSDTPHMRWFCRCDCGTTFDTEGTSLRKGATRSCGCIQREMMENEPHRLDHGHAGGKEKKPTPTYSTWKAMRKRCNNPNDQRYAVYGGRGIKVCERWDNFENFLADMGERPEGHSISRTDHDEDYCPENCSWALEGSH